MAHLPLQSPGRRPPGNARQVVPGFAVRGCDSGGRELPDGETGELWVRGGARALGYFRDADKSQATFRGEWVVSGDLVTRDADGYFAYQGRSDDALKVAGKWFLPAEVEGALTRHPAVSECAVVGVPNAEGLIKPHAFVALAPGLYPSPRLALALQEHVATTLELYKVPRSVRFVSEFPRTHLGKIDRAALRRW